MARAPAPARWRSISTASSTGSLPAITRASLWVLRHERATLLTTVATLVITIGLYAIVPKGFLPLQDTGLVQAVLEAGPEVSFAEMVKMQDAGCGCHPHRS